MNTPSRAAYSSLPWKAIIYGTRWRLKCHVAQVRGVKSSKGLQPQSYMSRKQTFSSKSTQNKDLETSFHMPNKYMMITSSLPSSTRYGDIIDSLSRILSRSNAHAIVADDPAVVILATPSFATWLENTPFISRILDLIFASARPKTTPEVEFEVTALLAVVDGLSPAEPVFTHPNLRSSEGFAILPCDHTLVLPRLWQLDEDQKGKEKHQRQKSSIVFSMKIGATREILEIDVPLANTMFQNGRTSTLLASKWRRSKDPGPFERTLQVKKQSVTIHPTPTCSSISLDLKIPLLPLTPPRRVISGLGNIIRQVMGAEEKVVSASQELEASVDAYLEARDVQKKIVSVWALILPESMMADTEARCQPESDVESIRACWTNIHHSNLSLSVGECLRYGQGATLHRVLSGGGGWGPKQGLLSLDPETAIAKTASARYDFELGDEANNEQLRALGNIARPNSWIQFLIFDERVVDLPMETMNVDGSVPAIKPLNSFAFGCIPSTIDSIPQTSSYPSSGGDQTAPRPLIQGFESHIGAQSESGIFVRVIGNKNPISSKIDVPFSTFRCAVMTK